MTYEEALLARNLAYNRWSITRRRWLNDQIPDAVYDLATKESDEADAIFDIAYAKHVAQQELREQLAASLEAK